jgi:hypothetical protein
MTCGSWRLAVLLLVGGGISAGGEVGAAPTLVGTLTCTAEAAPSQAKQALQRMEAVLRVQTGGHHVGAALQR